MTLADRLADVLACLAAGLLLWACVREGQWAAAVVVAILSATAAVVSAIRGRRTPPRTVRIAAGAQGGLWLTAAGQAPRRMYVGRNTRRIGSSVFLDLRAFEPGPGARFRRWLTPLDVRAAALRHWSVVLPGCGRTGS